RECQKYVAFQPNFDEWPSIRVCRVMRSLTGRCKIRLSCWPKLRLALRPTAGPRDRQHKHTLRTCVNKRAGTSRGGRTRRKYVINQQYLFANNQPRVSYFKCQGDGVTPPFCIKSSSILLSMTCANQTNFVDGKLQRSGNSATHNCSLIESAHLQS